jgi:hypothetical protein
MASEKAAATVPTIFSNDGHVNAGILSQGFLLALSVQI